jgi:multicomponent K+:H+ antiporter subunit E
VDEASEALTAVGIEHGVANLVVARQVLWQRRRLQPAFVELPLQRDDPLVAVLLACMITLTPGTLSVRIERHRLLVHALHAPDAAALAAGIKQRYERNLLEIFPC